MRLQDLSQLLPAANCEKQRLTSSRFLKIYRGLLREGGEIFQKTDSAFFFDYSLERYAENGFEVVLSTRDLHASAYAADNIVTEYEANFLAQGKPIYMARVKKV